MKHSAVLLFLAASAAFSAIPTTPGWHTLPNTKLATVCACTKGGFEQVCGVQGWYDCLGVFSWSGGVFDTRRNRLLVWGGGHNAYYGNEFYSLNLDDQTMTRLNDPGLPIAAGCSEAIAGGTQANSRHTYDGIEYMENLDKMFVFGGSLACGPGNFGRDTWLFDFASMKWEKKNPSGPIPQAEPGILAAYDPNTGLIFLNDRKYLFSYDAVSDRYTQLSSQYLNLGYHMSATIDSKRKKFIIAGYDAAAGGGRVYAYDILTTGTGKTIQTLATTGGSAIIGEANLAVEYDPVGDQIMAWNGGDVWGLNMDTRAWTRYTYTGAPPDPSDPDDWNCTFGRFRYSPKLDAFALVNEYNQDAYVFRLPGRTGMEKGPQCSQDNPLSVFPNPVRDRAEIGLPANTSGAAVYDLRGQKVRTLNTGSECVLDARPLPTGVYLLKVTAGRNSYTRRLLLQK